MNFKDQKSRIDSVASGYHLSREVSDKDFDKMFHDLCLEWLLPFLSNKTRVLQLGYGEGIIASGLTSEKCEMHIVEGADHLADAAIQNLGTKAIIHSSLFEDFKPADQFDCIVATNILEHVEDPVLVLKLAYNWLLPGGIVLVTVPNAESLHRRLAVELGIQETIYDLSPRDHVVGHLRVYDVNSLVQDCQSAGFRVIEKRGFVLKVLSNSQQLDLDSSLIAAMHSVSPLIPIEIQANIGLVLRK
jgi:2-polyprenyl-3-methyl-5-hydroxy-6-metoxy-1,4-benzoquinol methylase